MELPRYHLKDPLLPHESQEYNLPQQMSSSSLPLDMDSNDAARQNTPFVSEEDPENGASEAPEPDSFSATVDLLVAMLALREPFWTREHGLHVWPVLFGLFMFYECGGWMVVNALNHCFGLTSADANSTGSNSTLTAASMLYGKCSVSLWFEMSNILFSFSFFGLWLYTRRMLQRTRLVLDGCKKELCAHAYLSGPGSWVCCLGSDGAHVWTFARHFGFSLGLVVWWTADEWLYVSEQNKGIYLPTEQKKPPGANALLNTLCWPVPLFIGPALLMIDVLVCALNNIKRRTRTILDQAARRESLTIEKVRSHFDAIVVEGRTIVDETKIMLYIVNVLCLVSTPLYLFGVVKSYQKHNSTYFGFGRNLSEVVWFLLVVLRLDWSCSTFNDEYVAFVRELLSSESLVAKVSSPDALSKMARKASSNSPRDVGQQQLPASSFRVSGDSAVVPQQFLHILKTQVCGDLPQYELMGLTMGKALMIRLGYYTGYGVFALWGFSNPTYQ